MKLLIAVDSENYSDVAAQEGARLAVNAWADVTLLGVESSSTGNGEISAELAGALAEYGELFAGESSPYGTASYGAPTKEDNVWFMPRRGAEGRKQLRIVARRGSPLEAILAQAREDETDFIVIGSALGDKPEWIGEMNLPQKLAGAAPCSILVVKEEKTPKTMVCCLDHSHVSQESLEMINQFVTLHNAELEIVGISGAKGLKEEVENKMSEVLSYYTSRGIRSWVKLVKPEELGALANAAAKTSLVGLWLGKRSLLQKIFSRDSLEQLVGGARSSVLILK